MSPGTHADSQHHVEIMNQFEIIKVPDHVGCSFKKKKES